MEGEFGVTSKVELNTFLRAAKRSCAMAVVLGGTFGMAALAGGGTAYAADTAVAGTAKPAPAAEETPIESVLGPYADLGGLRSALKEKGITFELNYTGEVLSNTSGGVKRGTIYDGLLKLDVDADLGKLVGWNGATFHVSALQIHGRGLSTYNLENLMTASNIEAVPSTRLDELWLEQSLLGDKVAIRVGMLAADSTFLASDYAGTFVNATFGFPAIAGVALPNGGPAYPYTTPGVLVTLKPTDALSFMVEVQGSDPFGDHSNNYGANFRLDGSAFVIAEGKYSYKIGDLPGAVHIGGWYDGDNFADQRFTAAGLSIADPASSGEGKWHRGNYSIYAMLDQMLYHVPGTDDQGLGMFVRAAYSPPNRNLVDVYVDGGFTYKGLIPGRPNDVIGIAGAYAHISGDVAGLDRDTIAFTGTPMPVRDYEALIEATYQAEIVPGLTMQPDFQYIFHPGGNVADASGRKIKDAAVFGLRFAMKF